MPLKWTKWRPTASARSANQSSSSFEAAAVAARFAVSVCVSPAAELGAGASVAHPASRQAASTAAASRTIGLGLSGRGWAVLAEIQLSKAEKYVTIQPHGHWPMSADD